MRVGDAPPRIHLSRSTSSYQSSIKCSAGSPSTVNVMRLRSASSSHLILRISAHRNRLSGRDPTRNEFCITFFNPRVIYMPEKKAPRVRMPRDLSFFGILKPFTYSEQRYARHEQAPYDILHAILPLLEPRPFRMWSPPHPSKYRSIKQTKTPTTIVSNRSGAQSPIVAEFRIRNSPYKTFRSPFHNATSALTQSPQILPVIVSPSITPSLSRYRSKSFSRMKGPQKQMQSKKAKKRKMSLRIENSWPSL